MKIEKEKKMMISRKFLENLNFRVMNETDKMGFGGCASPVPLIAEFGDLIIVIDGNYCEVIDAVNCEQIEVCEDIIALGY